ncbi:MAG: glycosyltransferase family 2 protein [Verrucomicrobia bacterium]|nr:glycosyltransferase family 2 protein [Verrucomicrobiota bacterium]
MDFTIITPNLNYGRYLGECLQSVATQAGERLDPDGTRARRSRTWSEAAPQGVTLEHLVMDGGSSDDSAEVAAGFPHAEWLQAPDRGMSDAINKGFERATGDWVMWLNADDRLKPGALAAMLEHLNQSTADVVYGAWDFVNETGEFLRRVKALRWSAFVHLYHHCYVGSTAAFFRRETVLAQGYRLREDFHYVMDGEFYARLAAAGKTFEVAPVVVADFRLHGANASQRHLGKTRDMDGILAAERQHVESRAIRRAYGITMFEDPYLNGLSDGVLWIMARGWKTVLRGFDCLRLGGAGGR